MERVPDGAQPERTERELDAEKQAAVRRGGPAASQVVEKRVPDRVGERQEQGRADFGPWHADLARPPVDVVEIERTDLAGAQAVGGDEHEHRVVASPLRRRAVDRAQERAHRLPRQCTRKTLAAVDAGGLDLGVEPGRSLASGGEEPQKRPQGPRDLPHPASTHAPAGMCHERLDIGGAKLAELLRADVVVEEAQEPGDRRGVHLDCPGAKAADTIEVPPVIGDSTRGGGRQRRRQLAAFLQVLRQRADECALRRRVEHPGRRCVRQERRCRHLAQRTHPAPTERACQRRSGSHAPPDRVPRVAPRVKPDAESFKRPAQDGQGRVAGVGLREQRCEHRDLLWGCAERGAVPMLGSRVMWSRTAAEASDYADWRGSLHITRCST